MRTYTQLSKFSFFITFALTTLFIPSTLLADSSDSTGYARDESLKDQSYHLGGVVFNELSHSITLDGNDSDWANIARFNIDPDDVSGPNETINWRSVAMAHDTQFIHLLYDSYNVIDTTNDSGSYLPWGWQVYLDTDKNNSTGFRIGNIGADYIIEGQALRRYSGLGSNWNWQGIGVTESHYANNIAEIRFPRSLISNPGSLRLVIRGNSAAIGGSLIDDYPDELNDPSSSEQFFKYEFTIGAYLEGRPLVNSQMFSAHSNKVTRLTVDGSDEDWLNLTAFSDDPNHESSVADTINWQNATMAHSDGTLYLLYRNRGLINANAPSGAYIPWGWQAYLDTDNDPTTGFKLGNIGADFMIEASSLNKYIGTNGDWDWQTIDIADVAYKNDIVELAISLAAIGNPNTMRVAFQGDSASVGGTTLDYYPDDAGVDGVNNNFFSYRLNNVVARVSLRPQASNQTVGVIPNKSVPIRLNARDPEGAALSYKLIKAPDHGTLSVLDRIVTYTPEAKYLGDDSFNYVVNDGVFDSSIAKVSLTLRNEDGTVISESDKSTEDSGGGSVHWLFGIFVLFTFTSAVFTSSAKSTNSG